MNVLEHTLHGSNVQDLTSIMMVRLGLWLALTLIIYDFLVTVKAAPHECVIRTGQP